MPDPCAPPTPKAPPGVVLTVWPLRPMWPAARALIELARPAGVLVHGSAEGLAAVGEDYVGRMRDALTYQPDVWLGIGADGDRGPEAVERWAGVAELAARVGAVTVQVNAEGRALKAGETGDPARYQWTEEHAEHVTAAYAAMRAAAPGVPIGHTSWYSDALFPRYPWRAFTGPAGADYTHPQVYLPGASRAGLLGRLATTRESYGRMRADGRLAEGVEVGVYVGAWGEQSPAGVMSIAVQFDSVCIWGALPETDADGRRAIVGACLLRRLGYHGRGAIERFQRDHELASDGIAGPITQRMLGLP